MPRKREMVGQNFCSQSRKQTNNIGEGCVGGLPWSKYFFFLEKSFLLQPFSERCEQVRYNGENTPWSDVFFGPVCPYVLAPVARYSGVWDKPVLTTGGKASSFRGKDQVSQSFF